MKIQYASDLHLEFRENTELLAAHPLPVVGDILVLAGDTHVFKGKAWERHPFFDWCADNFQETYLIPGNHEYYSGVELSERFDHWEYAVRPNVRYLNNRTVRTGNVELFFTTLWTIVPPEEMASVQMGLTDCYRIKFQGRPFNAGDYITLHRQCSDWLSEALDHAEATHKVVITHHQPTLRISDPRFKSSPINSAFAVDMDDYIKRRQPAYWIYGHTHYNGGNGFQIGKTVLLSNQLGYVRHNENASFNPEAFIELQ